MMSSFSAAARAAHFTALGAQPFDLLVIGGGITGAGVAREAVMRGWRVALVERDDFASGTSSRSSRLIHGGLRYLEQGQLRLVYEASRERRILMRIAPHLVRPEQFVWPLYDNARLPAWKVRAGLALYDALALFRNIASHRVLNTYLTSVTEPELRPYGLRGAACYYDAATDDIRLTLANARSAAEAGACVVNHAAVRDLVLAQGKVTGAVVEDTLSGQQVRVSARAIVNATGPWSDTVRALARTGLPPAVRGTKGVHIAVPRDRVRNHNALTLLSPIDGRVMFILPAERLTIIGTTDTDYTGPLDAVRATTADIAYLMRSANAFFPRAHLSLTDVVSAWAGVRPLAATPDSDGAPGRVSREHAITWTAPGLLTITGGKLTTYRSVAEDVVREAAKSLGQRDARAGTERVALPGGAMTSCDDEIDAALTKVGSRDVARHLVHSHGTEWQDVWALAASDDALRAPLLPELPYIVAELHWAVGQEMALTLSDLLIRRLHVAYETADHALALAPSVARTVAPLLGWTTTERDLQLAEYAEAVERMFAVEE
ncbi:MAG: glycerol-3-phosphate dehydrogenase [Gemmatimonadaceae bacterium]